jgi:hypothetical protein
MGFWEKFDLFRGRRWMTPNDKELYNLLIEIREDTSLVLRCNNMPMFRHINFNPDTEMYEYDDAMWLDYNNPLQIVEDFKRYDWASTISTKWWTEKRNEEN